MSALKKKIQIPAIFFDEPLQNQTVEYWNLARIWNGRTESTITLMDAMYISNKLLDTVQNKRKLVSIVEAFKNDMVVYGTKSKKEKIERLNQPKQSPIATAGQRQLKIVVL